MQVYQQQRINYLLIIIVTIIDYMERVIIMWGLNNALALIYYLPIKEIGFIYFLMADMTITPCCNNQKKKVKSG